MRSTLVAVALLLAGCASNATEPSSEPTDQPLGTNGTRELSLPAPPLVERWEGRVVVAAGAGGPMGYQGAGMQDPPHRLEVPDDVESIYIELTWTADNGAAFPMHVRAINAGGAYHYGGRGAGTPEDPATLTILAPTPGAWTVEALVDEGAAAQQSYKFVASMFFGEIPEDYSAVE